MRLGWQASLLVSVLSQLPLAAQSFQEKPPQSVFAGPVLLRPGGFLEIGSISRSVASPDDMSTRFGAIPLGDGEAQEMLSVRHSRAQLKAEYSPWKNVKVSAYLESDFMNRASADPFRWRQYWGKVEVGRWEVLAGKGWSLLRPNRAGIDSETELMNTRVVDAGYHVGLIGNRDRQVRLVRHQGKWHFAVSLERGQDFLSKAVRDSKWIHLEFMTVTGRYGHRGVSSAAVIHATRRLDLVTQVYRAQGGGRDALATLPTGVRMYSTLGGAEYRLNRRTQVFAYYGTARGARSNGNRAVGEESAGLSREIWSGGERGRTMISLQYSRIGRDTWSGQTGRQTLGMVAVRHSFGR